MLFKSVIKVTILLMLLLTGCQANLPKEIEAAYNQLPDVIDFNYDVKPILSDNCYSCHGPDAANQKANLRLDNPESAFKTLHGNSNRYGILPEKPFKSEVVRRILSKHDDMVMPPVGSHLQLNNKQKATIIKWIAQGAKYEQHWAFMKPKLPQLPRVDSKDWPINEIDFFTLNKMRQNNLRPSVMAQKETLIRRLSFDLTGLPPTLTQIEAFMKDSSANAYEKVVDRLLDSEEYGERMAMDWMDVARFADSDGYLDDKHRDFTPWRDWVIEAFNKNMPYDQFITHQLAGDLIPNPTRDSKLATAFNRLHRKNSEAGIVFEEYRVEYVADRTQTMGKAFLGLTIECARCHDHKYDPITQENYYQLFSFFNSTNELGSPVYGPDQVPGPSLLLSTEKQNEIIAFLENDIATNVKELEKMQNSDTLGFSSWVNNSKAIYQSINKGLQKGLLVHYSFDNKNDDSPTTQFKDVAGEAKPAKFTEADIKKGAIGNAIFINDFTKGKLPEKVGWFGNHDAFSLAFYIYPDTVYDNAMIFTHCEDLRLGLKGYSLFTDQDRLKFIMAYSWPQNAIEVHSTPLPQNKWSHISITYDGSGKANGIKIYIDGKDATALAEQDNLYKSIEFKPDIHTYGFGGLSFGQRGHMKTFKYGGIDEFKIYDRALSALECAHLFKPTVSKSIISNKEKQENHKVLQRHFFQNTQQSFQNINDKLRLKRKTLLAHIDSIPEIMIMGDLQNPRPTYILERGEYSAKGKQVKPGVPSAILPFDTSLPPNRLGLAKWLFDPSHPLTSRVFVNRIWQQYFGKGLVKTSDDFGNQGALPSHPQLLDWLAIRFMESGWDIKELHKTIVMSATYQQSSKVKSEQLELDPSNIYLSRGPRFRLSAEMIRDNALAISGLLVKEIGGKSVYPYQPEGLWDEISNKHWRYKYLQKPGKGLYKRSLYSIWKRSSPPPSMMIFDAPDRSVCSVSRENTSTPLQALVLLNDPQYIEAARIVAEDLILAEIDNVPLQLEKAFALVTGRNPDSHENNLLQAFYNAEFAAFSKEKEEAIAYLSIGEIPRNESINPIQTASLATVINGIMNTSEAYTRK